MDIEILIKGKGHTYEVVKILSMLRKDINRLHSLLRKDTSAPLKKSIDEDVSGVSNWGKEFLKIYDFSDLRNRKYKERYSDLYKHYCKYQVIYGCKVVSKITFGKLFRKLYPDLVKHYKIGKDKNKKSYRLVEYVELKKVD